MKQLLYVAVMLLLSLHVVAQPTLTQHSNHSVGDSIVYYTCDTLGYSSGNDGANQTWDFSALKINDSVTYRYVDKANASSGEGAQFPKSNLVETSAATDIFLENTANEYHIVGVVTPTGPTGNTVIKYQDPQLLLKRPFTYQNSFKDTFKLNYSVSSFPTNGIGYSTTTADAYGTLKIKGQTYNNVLRIKNVSIRYDTMNGVPPPSNIITTHTTVLLWYDDIRKDALMRMDSIILSSSTFSNKVFAVSMRKEQGVTSVGHIRELTTFTCTAHNGKLSLNGLNSGKLYDISVYNTVGQCVYQQSFVAQGGNQQCQLSGMPEGIYIVRLREKGKLPQTNKLLMQ